MKRSFAPLLFVAATLVFTVTSQAQTADILGAPPYGPTHVGSRDMWDHLPRRRPELPREPRVIKEGPLAPSPEDRTAFSSFLEAKDTGLIRLLSRELMEREANHTGKLFFTMGGPFFSFAHRTHLYGYGSDIGLEQNHLSVGFAGADFGMMTNAGDVALAELTADDLRLQQLDAYRPPELEDEARAEYRRSYSPEGMPFDGFAYRKQVPVEENSTYFLRSISYGRSDVLVGFRLVRKDPDGSVIIAWKLLKRYPVTELKHSK